MGARLHARHTPPVTRGGFGGDGQARRPLTRRRWPRQKRRLSMQHRRPAWSARRSSRRPSSSTRRKHCNCAGRPNRLWPAQKRPARQQLAHLCRHPDAHEPLWLRGRRADGRLWPSGPPRPQQRPHDASARKTPWSRRQHPERESQAPATRSTAFGSTNPFFNLTAPPYPSRDKAFRNVNRRFKPALEVLGRNRQLPAQVLQVGAQNVAEFGVHRDRGSCAVTAVWK